MAEDFKYIMFKVIRASNLKYLFEQLDDEPRPFEFSGTPTNRQNRYAPGYYQGKHRGRC